MKKKSLALASTIGIVAASATIAVAATSTTANVTALATAESHVVTLLHAYAPTAAWKSELKAALTVQSADIAKLNSALTPTPPSGGTLFSQSGSGAQTTSQFTVPTSAKGWRINWAYNCSSFGSQGNFVVTVFQGTQMSFNDPGVNQLGVKGSGTEHNYDTGAFHLGINSECAWTVNVVAGS